MQTFLPYAEFEISAFVMDWRRLNKQITEAYQIALALADPNYGWQSHPAVRMWRGHRDALIEYGCTCYCEWQRRFDDGERGGKREHKAGEALRAMRKTRRPVMPDWMGDERFHAVHRGVLSAKAPDHYRQWWSEEPLEKIDGSWPYYWPVA